jgi:hypothetical protein
MDMVIGVSEVFGALLNQVQQVFIVYKIPGYCLSSVAEAKTLAKHGMTAIIGRDWPFLSPPNLSLRIASPAISVVRRCS